MLLFIPKPRQKDRRQKVDQLSDVHNVPTNKHSSHNESQLYIFEDSEAVNKIIIKGRSPTVRHVSRIHRGALDRSFDRINLEPQITKRYVDTNSQSADMLTKGSFSRDEWNHFLCLMWWISRDILFSHFRHFPSDDPHPIGKQSAMSKIGQKAPSDEGSPTAKAKPCLVLREQRSEEVSSRSLGSLVNPWNTDERKEVEIASRKLERPDSSSEVGFSQVNRQDNSPQASRKLVLENQNRTESDEKKWSDSKSSRKALRGSSLRCVYVKSPHLHTHPSGCGMSAFHICALLLLPHWLSPLPPHQHARWTG